MPDQSPPPPTGSGTNPRTGGGHPPRTPRWVWAALVVVGVLVALGVVLLLVSGGEHGPGRHVPTSAAPTSATAGATDTAGSTPSAGARR